MNETNYAHMIVSRIIGITIYIIFIIKFIMSGIMMFFNDKNDLLRIILVAVVIAIISIQLINTIKILISVIKEIKEKRKMNIYIRNIGQLLMGLSITTLIFGLLFRLINTNTNNSIIIHIFLFGFAISVVLITIDKILVVLGINNAILKIDKSDE